MVDSFLFTTIDSFLFTIDSFLFTMDSFLFKLASELGVLVAEGGSKLTSMIGTELLFLLSSLAPLEGVVTAPETFLFIGDETVRDSTFLL